MVIFWVIAGGCEEVLGDWGWLWVVVTILWVVGDDCGWLGVVGGDWGWLQVLVKPIIK